MTRDAFNQGLLAFLSASPTPFHAVEAMKELLEENGFVQLQESDAWNCQSRGKYFVIRGGSSLVAFNIGSESVLEQGVRIVGAHTDSPCLKVKPKPELFRKGYFQLGVEVYGGVLLNPWFDRDLSLAGRVTFKNQQGQLKSQLINFERAIGFIPSLAIHLDRDANNNRKINPQKDVPPLIMQADEDTTDFRELLLKQLQEQTPSADAIEVLDYDLSFYDVQPPSVVGLKQEFIASARLDNLLSCYIGLQALLVAEDQHCVLVCNDHEEVGSQSAIGAQGPMLKSILRRLVRDENEFVRATDKSLLISADNAHGVHPNFSDRHDNNHGPLLNQGPVIKTNANQRYATDGETSSLFRHFCELAQVPVQNFVVRTDMACGSTIGPLTAGELGVKTIDVGVPTFGMHSIRELAGIEDANSLYQALMHFFKADSVSIG